MGKISVKGKAERYCRPDKMEIGLETKVTGKLPADTSRKMNEEFENILAELEQIGINAEDLTIKEDSIEERRNYNNNNEICYLSCRKILLCTLPDMLLVNAVRDILERKTWNTTMSVTYSLRDESKIKKELVGQAVKDSRFKAELLADSVDQKITGVDIANLSGTLTPLTENWAVDDFDDFVKILSSSVPDRGNRSNLLKPEGQTVSVEVEIAWLIE